MDSEAKMKIENINMELIDLSYKRMITTPQTTSVHIEDKIDLVDLAEDLTNFTLLISRTVYSKPESITIKIDCNATYYVDEKSKTNFKNRETMSEYIVSKFKVLSNNAGIGEVMSLLIAQVTSSFGRVPLVVSPYISKDDEKRES